MSDRVWVEYNMGEDWLRKGGGKLLRVSANLKSIFLANLGFIN